MPGFLIEPMEPSLYFIENTFEARDFEARIKYVHTVGSVAKVQFVPLLNSEGYIGIFATGADHAIIRFSVGKEPDTSKTTVEEAYDNFAPGFALKFLRDG